MKPTLSYTFRIRSLLFALVAVLLLSPFHLSAQGAIKNRPQTKTTTPKVTKPKTATKPAQKNRQVTNHQKQAEAQRRQEQARRAEQQRQEEARRAEQQKQEEARRAEQQRLEEARRAEQQKQEEARKKQEEENKRKAVLAKLKSDMVYVAGGTFTMGALRNDKDADRAETPRHQVTLSSFYISKYEVTQELWQAVMGSNPSYFKGDLQRPVEKVSWNDCDRFIRKLNALTGEQFRLPTEAEWEYAARGGQKSRGYLYSGSNYISVVAWYGDNSNNTTHPVGGKQPNELGLYDMTGNVWEWCQDWYGSYGSSAQTNPTGPASASYRVHRGGCWINLARRCRASIRDFSSPDNSYNYLGLRLALTKEQEGLKDRTVEAVRNDSFQDLYGYSNLSPKQEDVKDRTVEAVRNDIAVNTNSNQKVKQDVAAKVFAAADQMPSFPGGQGALFSFLSSNVKYPAVAEKNNIQGKAIVGFIVEPDGSVTGVHIMLSAGDPSLDAEAMRVVGSMPRWNPGKQDGQAVRVKYQVPITFRLQDANK